MAVAGVTDEALIAVSAQWTLQTLIRCVGIGENDVVLEIGAGVGRVGVVLAPLCREWIGTDVSDNMARYIQQRLAQFSNVRAIATNGYDLSPVSLRQSTSSTARSSCCIFLNGKDMAISKKRSAF